MRLRLFLASWALVLATLWVGEGYIRTFLLAAREPRAVIARGSLADAEHQAIEIFDRIAPSVAYIFTRSASFESYGRLPQERGGTGSGFVWDAAGHIVTNHHVIAGASQVAVRLDNSEPITARIVGSAPDFDLVVLKLASVPAALQPIPLGRSDDLRTGQLAYAIGNPFGLSRTLTTGVISALDRTLPTSAGREITSMIQTDASINPGNSGGPLLDSAGLLIGVNTAIISGSGASAGLGFAIPVDTVNRIVPQLIRSGTIPRPGIGIIAADQALVARLGIRGVVISEVLPDSAAAQAGLRGIARDRRRFGDVITHVNDTAVGSVAELATELTKIGIGNRATLTILRDRHLEKIEVAVVDITRKG